MLLKIKIRHSFIFLILGTGCFLASLSPLMASPLPSAAKNAPKSPDPARVDGEDGEPALRRFQQMVMDFSDEYMASVGAAMDEYIAKENDPAKRVAAAYWKVRCTSSAMSIACAHDPRMNLLDMLVFISAGKWSVNNYWIPKVFGANAEPLAKVYDDLDVKIWAIASQILTPQQQADLRQLLANWEHSNPRYHEIFLMRLRNLDGVRLGAFDDGHRAWGILGALRKFLKRMDKSLLYGERLMFALDHTPEILAQQSELTIAQVGQAFPLAAVRPEVITNAVMSFPEVLQEGLDRNEGSLKTLLPQLGATLKSADSLATTLNASVQTLGSNSKVGDPMMALQQANQALTHLDASISGINQLLSNNTTGGLATVEMSRQIDTRVSGMMDAAFHRVLLVLGAFFSGVVLLLVAVKVLFFRKG
jgi:hypothetical protein